MAPYGTQQPTAMGQRAGIPLANARNYFSLSRFNSAIQELD